MRHIVTCIAGAALLAGCNLESTVINDRSAPLADLAARRTAWEDDNISNYDFDYVHDCECPEAAQVPVTIEVRADQVFRVLNQETGAEIAPASGISWPTMDSLFVWAKAELEDQTRGVQILFAEEESHITRLRSFHIETLQGLDDHLIEDFAVVVP